MRLFILETKKRNLLRFTKVTLVNLKRF